MSKMNENKIEFLSIKEIEYKDDASMDVDANNFDRVSYALVSFDLNGECFDGIMVQGSAPFGFGKSQYWEISRESGNEENEKFFAYVDEKELDVNSLESEAGLHKLVDEEVENYFEEEDMYQQEAEVGNCADEVNDFFASDRAKDFGFNSTEVLSGDMNVERIAESISSQIIEEEEDFRKEHGRKGMNLAESKFIKNSVLNRLEEESDKIRNADKQPATRAERANANAALVKGNLDARNQESGVDNGAQNDNGLKR